MKIIKEKYVPWSYNSSILIISIIIYSRLDKGIDGETED